MADQQGSSSSSGQEGEPPPPPPPLRRTRARSNSIRGGNPLETPITDSDYHLARLGTSINERNARSRGLTQPTTSHVSRFDFQDTVEELVQRNHEDIERQRREGDQRERRDQRASLFKSGGYSGTTLPIRSNPSAARGSSSRMQRAQVSDFNLQVLTFDSRGATGSRGSIQDSHTGRLSIP